MLDVCTLHNVIGRIKEALLLPGSNVSMLVALGVDLVLSNVALRKVVAVGLKSADPDRWIDCRHLCASSCQTLLATTRGSTADNVVQEGHPEH